MAIKSGLVPHRQLTTTNKNLIQECDRKITQANGEALTSPISGVSLNVETFEGAFFRKAYFLGEHKLDQVLLSLLHLIDAKSSIVEDIEGITVITNSKNFDMRIRKHTNKSIRTHYNLEKQRLKEKFSYAQFSKRCGIPIDTINGTFSLRFKNSRRVFHSLRISYALFLTMKMFKIHDMRTSQRIRNNKRVYKRENLLTSLFVQIYSGFARLDLSEKAMIKCLKTSLCLMVSKAFKQSELPIGVSIDLFPSGLEKQIRKQLSTDDFVRFCFSCLQSKVLCETVPDDFIMDALIEHRNKLSQPHRGLEPKTLDLLREKGRTFGKHVARYYRSNKGHFPTNKASFAFPRNRGGVKGDLVFHNRLKDLSAKEDPDDRMEPFVIGLFGQPGSGKSSRINQIVAELSKLFPGVPMGDKLIYQRTCHVDHWDGYTGQPITIFDDLGQSMDGHDIKEFQTLVSCCPYILPMAHLDNKGQKFCSPIIIATSNLHYGSSLAHVYQESNPIIDDASFWRRFHVPLQAEDGKIHTMKIDPTWVRSENLLFRTHPSQCRNRSGPTFFAEDKMFFRRQPDFDRGSENQIWNLEPYTGSWSFLRTQFKERCRYHDNFRSLWIQTVVDKCQDTSVLDPLLSELEEFGFTQSFDFKEGEGGTKCLTFPAFPPPGPLPVRVEPIAEPLKVRTITAGKGDTFCLKPLQRAMWLALGDFPQYQLTHGTNRLDTAIAALYDNSSPDDVWISGDYTAATDSFAIEGSKALLEGILESIDHEPTKRWAMKEISPHLLVYPKGSGLEPVLQASGQLMGSLLSFPLLCLLNDCTASFCGLKSDQYLINGDDILMRANPSIYPEWKKQVHEFGLDLSPGKNYIHSRYGTVNSQLIIDGLVVSSGKQQVLDRRSRVLGECLRDLEFQMKGSPTEEIIDLFKSVNRSKLSQSIRDINVPISHGGLSFSWGVPRSNPSSKRTAMLCYLYDMFKRIEPQKECIAIPYLSIEEKNISDYLEEERVFNDPNLSSEYHEEFIAPYVLNVVQKRCMKNSHLRDILLDQDIKNLPALSFLRTYQIPCTDVKVRKDIQREVDSLFLSRFLQGGQGFGYDVFRKEFLQKMSNIPSSVKSVKHLVALMDLNIPQDYLQYLNLNFNPLGFDSKRFEKNLGKALSPSSFDLPEVVDFEDFSLEVGELLALPRDLLTPEKETELRDLYPFLFDASDHMSDDETFPSHTLPGGVA